MSTETISISFLGVDERSKSAYQVFFKSMNQGQYLLIDDYNKAQLCLVDKDSYNIREKYNALINSNYNGYILLLSIQEQSCENDKEFFLKKPIKRDSLQKALDEIYCLITGENSKKVLPFKKTKNSENQQSAPIIKEPDEKTNSIKIHTNSFVKIPQNKKKKISTFNAGKLLQLNNQTHFIGEQNDVDINNPKQIKQIIYSPDNLLQTIVEKACVKSRKKEKIIEINILKNLFYFDYQEQKVYCKSGPGTIRPLCLIQHKKNIIYKEKDYSYRATLHELLQTDTKKSLDKQTWNMDAFKWLISLWSSRGRVPHETDLLKPVYLTQWPNFTRLASIPHAVNIAALLYNRPHLLTDVATQLGIEQRYVFAFYSASKSIGLSGLSHREVDNLFKYEKSTPKRNKNKNKFILSKLLGKLINFSDKPGKVATA